LNRITAVICTKDRGHAVLAAARSVLDNLHPNFQLIVVDQSADDESRRALEALRGDERLCYVRSTSRGLSRSRNEALRYADTPIVVFTDDDCTVPVDWISTMQQVLDEAPDSALAFCKVSAGPHDASKGFVPAYSCEGTRIHRSYCEDARGMGAGLAVRRSVALEVGGFDESLGAGARFPSCEDRDLVLRALLAGHAVCTTDRTSVTHLGFRSWEEGRRLVRDSCIGIGAAYAKPLRAGHWSFLHVAVRELLLVASLWKPMNELLHFRAPRGLGRVYFYLRGFLAGMRMPLDRRRLVYVEKADS